MEQGSKEDAICCQGQGPSWGRRGGVMVCNTNTLCLAVRIVTPPTVNITYVRATSPQDVLIVSQTVTRTVISTYVGLLFRNRTDNRQFFLASFLVW